MPPFQLQIRSHPRGEIPADLGPERWLVQLVTQAVAAGRGQPAGVVLRERSIDFVDLGTAKGAGLKPGWVLAGLTSSVTPVGGRAEAVGILGRHTHKRRQGSVEVAVVFLEWDDCRWWMWEAVVGNEGQASEDRAVVQSAADGDPLPLGVGRWWSSARRDGLRFDLEASVPTDAGTAVH